MNKPSFTSKTVVSQKASDDKKSRLKTLTSKIQIARNLTSEINKPSFTSKTVGSQKTADVIKVLN